MAGLLEAVRVYKSTLGIYVHVESYTDGTHRWWCSFSPTERIEVFGLVFGYVSCSACSPSWKLISETKVQIDDNLLWE